MRTHFLLFCPGSRASRPRRGQDALDPLGRLVAGSCSKVEQLDRRLDSIERAIAELRGEVRASIRWLIGIQIASLIAIGSLLFSILGKLP